jgi:hypothetical protein
VIVSSVRKPGSTEVALREQRPLGARALVAHEYDAYLADFAAGDYGRVELAESEPRNIVRGRLRAAAGRRGLALRFRRGPRAALIFHVEAAPPLVSRPALPLAAAANQWGNGAAQREPAPSRLARRSQSAAERYHNLLPRWMREGQHMRRPGRSKRRAR